MANISSPMPSKIKKEILASPMAFTSPASETFAKRSQKGKVIAEVGNEFIKFATDEADLVVRGNKGDSFCYMGQKPMEVSDILYDYIVDGVEKARKSLEVENEGEISATTQESVELVGMIMLEANECFLTNGDVGVSRKLYSYFHSRKQDLTINFQVQLDFDECESFHVYSGMFCAVKGVNPTGDAFVVSEVRPTAATQTEAKREGPIQNTSKTSTEILNL